jgi:[acyl-carrier-protein] S-malonyltransferase
MSRAAVVFPGRGSYAAASLGSVPAHHAWVARADELRAVEGLPELSRLDGAGRFDPAVHPRPVNAWPLAFLAGLLDAERIAQDHEAVVVTASSTGWYTALAAAGVLDFDDAFRLVQRMASAADGALPDGQPAAELVYPLADEAWVSDPARAAALHASLDGNDDGASIAVDLGAFALVGGSQSALDGLATRLEPANVGGRTFPLRLPVGDGWHTPLRAEHARAAATELTGLAWSTPSVTLVDGQGRRHTPWSADPAELARITMEELPVTRHDTATAVRVALREHAPDVLLLPGPGGSLGAACAHLVVAEGFRGIRSRDDFEGAQRSDAPILLSMRR